MLLRISVILVGKELEPDADETRRQLSMVYIVVTALKAHRTRQLEEWLAAGGTWEESGLVFTSPIGTALDSRNVQPGVPRAA